MNDVLVAIEFARDRLLVASVAFRDGDQDAACEEITLAAERLREAAAELRGEDA